MKPQVSPDVTDLEVNPDPLEPKKKPRHRQWGGAVLGLLFGIGALSLGRAGQLWPAFDVAAQFGAQALCVVCGFSIAAFMPRFKGTIGLVLSGLLIIAYGAWPLAVSQKLNTGPFTLSNGERPARFMQFNTWKNNTDVVGIVNEIKRLAPDVVALEEISTNKREVLFRLRSDYPYQYGCEEVEYCQFALLSREPILATDSTIHWKGPPYIMAKLGGRLQGVTVFVVHTLRFPMSRAQLIQANGLVKRLEGETDHLVVMGDFNATPFSRITGLVSQGTGLKRLTSLPSWPTWLVVPQLAIDHIFVSPDIRLLAPAQLGQASGSDHFPVVVNVAIPKT